MNRRKLISIFLILIVCICIVFTIRYFVKDNEEELNENTYTEETNDISINTISSVFFGTISSAYSCEGKVTTEEQEYIDVFYIEYDTIDRAEVYVELGKEIKTEDVLYSYKGKKVLSTINGMVVDVIDGEDLLKISILNFDKQYIEVDVPYELYKMMNYNSKTDVIIDGEKRSGNIYNLGYKLEDDKVKMKVSFAGYILPGRIAEVNVDLGDTKEMLFVPSFMIVRVGDISYCNVLIDKETKSIEQRQVEIGQEYMSRENNSEFYYTEILSGVEEGEMIVTFDE